MPLQRSAVLVRVLGLVLVFGLVARVEAQSFETGYSFMEEKPAQAIPAAAADPYEVLHSFTLPPSRILAGLIEVGGKLYGVSLEGGAFAAGTAFEVEPSTGQYRVLHSFSSDEGAPWGRLAWVADDPAGPALYGTTSWGGAFGKGTAFRLTLDGQFETVHDFKGGVEEGAQPRSALVRGLDGWLYGTTTSDGAGWGGTVFRIRPGHAAETVYSFDGRYETGYNPTGDLAIDAAGTLYGVANTPGHGRYGAIYRIRFADGTAVHEFLYVLDVPKASEVGYNTLGISVAGEELLVTTQDSTTTRGGTVFAFHPETRVARLLHEFNPDTEGRPQAAPVADAEGTFVGATSYGWVQNIYRIALNGAFSLVAPLDYYDEGQSPTSALLRATDGCFYGTTSQGGGANIGAVYAVDAAGARAVVEFGEGAVSWSAAGLARTETGGLLGVTWWGGTSGLGTVFGTEDDTPVTTRASFEARSQNPGTGYDRAGYDLRPSRPVLASDGAFYMATRRGGAYYEGAIVRHQPGSGVVETMVSFGPAWQHPRRPMALVPGPGGRLYGVTSEGGPYNGGHVFYYEPGSSSVVPIADLPAGSSPEGGLAVDADGNVYGHSAKGVYKVDAQGNLTSLNPVVGGRGGMVLSPDGWLYATTHYGGSATVGTFFRMRTDGKDYTLLHEFTGGADGCLPFGDLSLGPGSVVLGTTAGFSSYSYSNKCQRDPMNRGSLFQWGSAGFSLLHTFSLPTGASPVSAPILGADGNLYGTTTFGGPDGGGVVYRIRLAPEVSLDGPHAILEGANVMLTATGSDPQGGELGYAWDLDDDGAYDDGTGLTALFAADQPARDGDGQYEVAVRVTDATGLSAVARTTVTVSNVAPTVSIVPATLVLLQAGESAAFTASFTDPGPDTWKVHVDYGDGASETRTPASPGPFDLVHAYTMPGSYQVVVTVFDDDGASGQAMAEVNVGSPTSNITWLIGRVKGLIDDGTLKLGQGKSLVGKLELALNMLGYGNAKKAITMLEAFIQEVRAFKNAGILEPGQADEMIRVAEAAIASLAG
jgi:uncharacterized repeat protein (TIGR03803 family)